MKKSAPYLLLKFSQRRQLKPKHFCKLNTREITFTEIIYYHWIPWFAHVIERPSTLRLEISPRKQQMKTSKTSFAKPDMSVKRRNIASSRKKRENLFIDKFDAVWHTFFRSFLARRFQFLPRFTFLLSSSTFQALQASVWNCEKIIQIKKLFINLNIFLPRRWKLRSDSIVGVKKFEECFQTITLIPHSCAQWRIILGFFSVQLFLKQLYELILSWIRFSKNYFDKSRLQMIWNLARILSCNYASWI